jgi:hypothetical protein
MRLGVGSPSARSSTSFLCNRCALARADADCRQVFQLVPSRRNITYEDVW